MRSLAGPTGEWAGKYEGIDVMRRESHGYVAAVIGGVLGGPIIAFLTGYAALQIGYQFDDPNRPCDEFMCFHGFVAVAYAIFVAAASVPFGAGMGAGLILRLRGHSHSLLTSGLLAGLMVFAEILSWIVVPTMLLIAPDFTILERIAIPLLIICGAIPLAMLVAGPLISRLLVLKVMVPNMGLGRDSRP